MYVWKHVLAFNHSHRQKLEAERRPSPCALARKSLLVSLRSRHPSIRSAMSSTPRLGILAAMPPEIEKLKQTVENQEDHKHGSAFTFTTGTLGGRPVVFAAANVSVQAQYARRA